MGLRLQLLLLVAFVVLLVADNISAREETKLQESPESADTAAGSKGKSKEQKNDKPTDTDKVHVKQKWQRYKTPSSKKIKKADLWKEKAVGKSEKEKWKAGIEEPSKQKKKRSTDYGKQLHQSKKGKWGKKDKMWKHNTSRDKRSQVNEEVSVKGNEFVKNKPKIGYSKKEKGKVAKKDKWKLDLSNNICLKDKPCSDDGKMSNSGGKNVWNRKYHSDEENSLSKSVKLSKTKFSDPDSEILNDGEEVESDKESGVDTQKNEQNSVQDEANYDSKDKSGSETKEETEPKTNDNNNKKKSKASVLEQKEYLSVEPETQTKFSKPKGLKVQVLDNTADILNGRQTEFVDDSEENKRGSQKIKRSYIVEEEFDPDLTSNLDDVKIVGAKARIRRYIVEEEVVDDSGVGEVAASESEIPQLMH